MKLPNGEHAIVPIEKLRDYCLNPAHRVGGNKARVFESVLGLTSDHAEQLQHRLLISARTGDAVVGMQDVYGQRYMVDSEMEPCGHCYDTKHLDHPGWARCPTPDKLLRTVAKG